MEKPTSGKSNRLAQEKSPYLLQHKDNPVDWYPWGEAAYWILYLPLVPCHGARIL